MPSRHFRNPKIINTGHDSPRLNHINKRRKVISPKGRLKQLEEILVTHPIGKISRKNPPATALKPHINARMISNDRIHINDSNLTRQSEPGGPINMKVTETHYIFPPRAEHCIPRNDADMYFDLGWKAQIKYNDTRLLIKYLPNGKVELWNRHGMRVSYTPPDTLIQQLNDIRDKLDIQDLTILDGGLLDSKHPAIKDQIVIWDMIVHNTNHLLGTTYEERYQRILGIGEGSHLYDPPHKKHPTLDIGVSITTDIFCPRWYDRTQYGRIWEIVQIANAPFPSPVFEGSVIKDPTGILEIGFKVKNNTNWQVKSRVKTGRHQF
jgi:hypothetical protein